MGAYKGKIIKIGFNSKIMWIFNAKLIFKGLATQKFKIYLNFKSPLFFSTILLFLSCHPPVLSINSLFISHFNFTHTPSNYHENSSQLNLLIHTSLPFCLLLFFFFLLIIARVRKIKILVDEFFFVLRQGIYHMLNLTLTCEAPPPLPKKT